MAVVAAEFREDFHKQPAAAGDYRMAGLAAVSWVGFYKQPAVAFGVGFYKPVVVAEAVAAGPACLVVLQKTVPATAGWGVLRKVAVVAAAGVSQRIPPASDVSAVCH